MSINLIPAAMAATSDAAGTAHQGGDWSFFIFMIAFIALFYFILWRPQSKRAKEHKNLIAGLAKGDEVVTNGGILGKIVKVSDDFVVLSIAENVEVVIQKGAIGSSVPKGTMKSL